MERGAPLEQLATQLYTSARTITLFCEQENHPHRSFDRIEPATLLPDNAPQSILAAQQTINEAATRIQQLVIDPTEFLGAFQVQVCLNFTPPTWKSEVIRSSPLQFHNPHDLACLRCLMTDKYQ